MWMNLTDLHRFIHVKWKKPDTRVYITWLFLWNSRAGETKQCLWKSQQWLSQGGCMRDPYEFAEMFSILIDPTVFQKAGPGSSSPLWPQQVEPSSRHTVGTQWAFVECMNKWRKVWKKEQKQGKGKAEGKCRVQRGERFTPSCRADRWGQHRVWETCARGAGPGESAGSMGALLPQPDQHWEHS